MCIVAMFVVLLRCILLQIEFNLGSRYVILCKVFSVAYTLLGTVCYLCVYTLLWTRQWGLYNNNPLKTLLTRKMRIISYAILIGLVVGMFGLTTLFVLGFKISVSTPNGCVYYDTESEKMVILVTLGVMVTSSIFFQISLLALTIYPLSKQYGTFWWCCKKKQTDSTSISIRRVQVSI